MIAPLLRIAAGAAAARSLRAAAREATTHALLTLGAVVAIGVAAVCFSFSAFALLERHLEPAGASAIVGGFWGVLGLAYFVATRRRN